MREDGFMQAANGPNEPAPNDRSTSFQPVEGGAEQRSGFTLMVEAYTVIWMILMVWLVVLWRKQSRLNQRLDGLESAIDRAASRTAKGSSAAKT
jgi:CcmD family protein